MYCIVLYWLIDPHILTLLSCSLNIIHIYICRMEGHNDLADRLVECQYELTDRLAYFLCGRKPGKKGVWQC